MSKVCNNVPISLYWPGNQKLYAGQQSVVPLHYICLSCQLGCIPRHQNFRKTSKLSYYFNIVKQNM